MTGDVGHDMCAWDEHKKLQKKLHGVACPDCVRLLPKANPSILLPQQRCRIHGYRDQRTPIEDIL